MIPVLMKVASIFNSHFVENNTQYKTKKCRQQNINLTTYLTFKLTCLFRDLFEHLFKWSRNFPILWNSMVHRRVHKSPVLDCPFWTTSIQFTISHPISLLSILILPSICVCVSQMVSREIFLNEILTDFPFLSPLYTCTASLKFLDLLFLAPSC
jgi:hypothetical protein